VNLRIRKHLFKILSILCLLIFSAFKYQDLFLPYFWDEMAAYSNAVLYMMDHNISLLPSSVPPEISFGHPLLLPFLLSVVNELFGYSIPLMHACILLISLLLAFGTFLLAHYISKNNTIAFISMVILLFQPVFFAQSTLVLLEVFLTLNFVYALLYYLKGKYLLASIFASMAVLTKETGLVIAVLFLVYPVFDYVLNKNKEKIGIKIAISLLPIGVFAAFLLAQKSAYGWYLNPYNLNATKLTINSILQKTWDYSIEFSFVNQGRFILTILTLVSTVIFFKKIKWNFKEKSILLLLIFSFGFVLFSSIAHCLERYFIVLMPIVSILFATSVYRYVKFNKFLPYLLIIVVFIIQLYYMNNSKKFSDVNLSFKDHIKSNQMLFDYINSGKYINDTFSFSFPLKQASIDARVGYAKQFNFHSDLMFIESYKYQIYCQPGNFDSFKPDTTKYELFKEFKSGISRSMIYIRK
jgi:4-amino-4-deoxy-L-arabinose transferase-like glycosyltransferase